MPADPGVRRIPAKWCWRSAKTDRAAEKCAVRIAANHLTERRVVAKSYGFLPLNSNFSLRGSDCFHLQQSVYCT